MTDAGRSVRQGEPARSLRRPPSADHLSLHVGSGRFRGLPGLLAFGRQHPHLAHLHATPRSCSCPRTARQDRALPGADGLDRPVVFPVRERLQFDFHVTTDEAVARVEDNYQDKATLERKGETYHLNGEQPGLSVFLCVGRQYFSHLLDLWARARGVAGHVPVPRPDAARPTGGLREFTRRMAADLEQWRILGPPPGQVDKRPGNSDAGCHSAEDRVTMRSPSGNVASQP